MTSTLDRVLTQLGYSHRPQQDALFDGLRNMGDGAVFQAGTGTGKSIAVLAAAWDASQDTGRPSLVVCPTNILLDQYVNKDAPAVAEALGANIRPLKGRNRYLCGSARAFGNTEPGEDVSRYIEDRIHEMRRRLADYTEYVYEPQDPYWFGCPGSDDCDKKGICHYRRAKELTEDADIIVTNAHLLVIDHQLKAMDPVEKKVRDEDGMDTGEVEAVQPHIFPTLGTVFVDEAHTLEGVLRDFSTSAISLQTLRKMGGHGLDLAILLNAMNHEMEKPANVVPDFTLVDALRRTASWRPAPDEKGTQRRVDAAAAAAAILKNGQDGVYRDRHAVLWFDPAEEPKHPRLVSTQINLAWTAAQILTKQPFALVSATIPKTMQMCLGVSQFPYKDVGHPFDYAKQASISFSGHSGAYKDAIEFDNLNARCKQVRNMILSAKGGALLLFSAFKDLEAVYEMIAPDLKAAGLTVLKQERESDDKVMLGTAFRNDGNAVLFASKSFATGFDCPGWALRLLVVWKAAYPPLDPVTGAIAAQNRQRYFDIMAVDTVQAIGRLIRTTSDRGHVFCADSRLKSILMSTTDPMMKHVHDFRLLPDPA